MHPNLVLNQIFIYPIKSLGGILVEEATVEMRGLQYDRRWLLVDENNQFLTQRSFPEMALLKVCLQPNGLQVDHKVKQVAPLHVPFYPTTNKENWVQIWDDVVQAIEVSEEANNWFTAVLGRKCRLVFMPDNAVRQTDLDYAAPGELVSFADSFPILIIGQASLDDLNSRLPEPVPINRFRPNLVFTNGVPFMEDSWLKFKIGDVYFKGVKPCARCNVTTINQETTEKGPEPLRTLATYRKTTGSNKVNFGQNVIPENTNQIIRVGQNIELLKKLDTVQYA